MERDHPAIDGLLRELARAPQGDDDAFVSRVMARTRRPASQNPALALAAAVLVAMGVCVALATEGRTGHLGFDRQACLVPEATHMRVLLKDPANGGLLLLGQVPIHAPARVPSGAPLLLQALGADGMALWTSPDWIQVPRSRDSGPAATLDPKSARSVEFARDVKPILDQHCAGCHAEGDLVRTAVKPFEARRSPLVTQTHAPLSGSDRLQLALWVDLGASGRP